MRSMVLVAVLVAVVSTGCGEESSPTLPSNGSPANTPPVFLSWEPPSDTLDVHVGESVTFSVEVSDPDGDPLSVQFLADGVEAAGDASWTLDIDTERARSVSVVVSDGEAVLSRQWTVRGSIAPPPAVRILDATPLPDFGELSVAWLPGVDALLRPLAVYEIRASPAPFDSDGDWDAAVTRQTVSAPAGPVRRMAATLKGLESGAWYVTVRGLDSRGRLGRMSGSVQVRIVDRRVAVTVMDAVTRLPLGGLRVTVAGVVGETDANGQYVLEGCAHEEFELLVDDGNADGIGGYFDYFGVHSFGHTIVQLIPDEPVASASYPDFSTMYRHLTTIRGIPEGGRTRRWELPLNVYVPAYTNGGLDYQATILAALEDLERVFRRDLFTLVDRPPSVGLRIVYDRSAYVDRYAFESFTADHYPERGRITFRAHYAAAHHASFLTVVRHELGHALGLVNHSPDLGHLMVGGTAPLAPHFTPDERRVLGTFLSLPRGADPLLFIQE